MPFTSPGQRVTSKSFVDLQLVVDSQLGKSYVPFKALNFERTSPQNPEHSAGSSLPHGLTQQSIDYKGSFEVGTWILPANNEAYQELAANWEYILSILENIADEGRPIWFDIKLSSRMAKDVFGAEIAGSGQMWAGFVHCKLTGDSYNIGENDTGKRVYPWQGMRRILGAYGMEQGGQL